MMKKFRFYVYTKYVPTFKSSVIINLPYIPMIPMTLSHKIYFCTLKWFMVLQALMKHLKQCQQQQMFS